MWFLTGVRVRVVVFVCVRACARVRVFPIFNVSNLDNSWTAWDIDMEFGTSVKQSQPFNRTIFMSIDARFVILWDFEFFEKCPW